MARVPAGPGSSFRGDDEALDLPHSGSPPGRAGRARPFTERGLTHLSFRVADLDATLEALRAAGERVCEETVVRFPEFQAGAALVTDPDGQVIELVQAPGDPAAPPRA